MSDHKLEAAATAAATRVVLNSASLTAVSFVDQGYETSPPPMLPDLLAAGLASGLANRLRQLTGIRVQAACALQQLQALRQCTGLTNLDISGSDLQDCPAANLAAALQAMPGLTRLHLCSCTLQSQRVAAALGSALQSLTRLQHLHLARSRLRQAGLAALVPALSAMPDLQTLDVGATSMPASGPQGANALCTLLGAVPGLTHLDVSFSRLQDGGTLLLAAVLRSMTRLQTLNMYGSHLGDAGMLILAPALAELPHLHTLDLCGNELGASAVSMLRLVLAKEGSSLRNLDLGFNGFKMEGAQLLASGLSTATQLQGLSLEQTWLGDEGWVALAPALSCLGPSLQSLQLGPGSLDDAGSVALAAALHALTGLTHLKVTSYLQSTAIATISPALMGMRRLQALEVSGTPMRPQGTAAFAAALPAIAGSLKHLNLTSCRIDVEAAATALAPALAQATGLVELRLANNDLGAQGVQWLATVLGALPHLRTVDLWSCKIGVEGCMAVARALKDRDGALVYLACNGVNIHSIEGDELRNMPGISIVL